MPHWWVNHAWTCAPGSAKATRGTHLPRCRAAYAQSPASHHSLSRIIWPLTPRTHWYLGPLYSGLPRTARAAANTTASRTTQLLTCHTPHSSRPVPSAASLHATRHMGHYPTHAVLNRYLMLTSNRAPRARCVRPLARQRPGTHLPMCSTTHSSCPAPSSASLHAMRHMGRHLTHALLIRYLV